MKINAVLQAPVIDMFSREWEFDGKKGTSHFVVVYDFENHRAERLTVDPDNASVFEKVRNISLFDEYKLNIELTEAYDKVKKTIIGVEKVGQ